ncbi:hypothetical protein HNR15_000603 [Allobranchiibius huperziae]|uniref:Uncharacterized protein n=1 Tax=Allobranchiibius huperziae TaxID=1874116 RepID=A0A853DG22_9MICO|nr:hypothetical protein [Allobranchiibius huperziae]
MRQARPACIESAKFASQTGTQGFTLLNDRGALDSHQLTVDVLARCFGARTHPDLKETSFACGGSRSLKRIIVT